MTLLNDRFRPNIIIQVNTNLQKIVFLCNGSKFNEIIIIYLNNKITSMPRYDETIKITILQLITPNKL